MTIEGIECVGKSTNAKFIENTLNKKGYKTLVTREPGGSGVGEKIRNILLFENKDTLSPMTELLLLFAAREKHINEIIKPALRQGTWVICDRFTDASFAYQGFGRELGFDKVNALKSLIQKDFEPELTILLDAPLEIITSRRKLNPNDRFESEDKAFFERVRNGYLELANIFDERVKVIDASKNIQEVQDQILILINDLVRNQS
ncbi:MAG: dTMP kinase [Gammaproteobacteria bacterium]|nr:dTMP kinase [Gammaproteobacteria bacterium]